MIPRPHTNADEHDRLYHYDLTHAKAERLRAELLLLQPAWAERVWRRDREILVRDRALIRVTDWIDERIRRIKSELAERADKDSTTRRRRSPQ